MTQLKCKYLSNSKLKGQGSLQPPLVILVSKAGTGSDCLRMQNPQSTVLVLWAHPVRTPLAGGEHPLVVLHPEESSNRALHHCMTSHAQSVVSWEVSSKNMLRK